MIIYSETIFAFIEKCEQYIKDIINHETPYSRLKRRVLVINKYYPVSVVVFSDKAQLGYYCPQSYQIGLNEKLIYNIKEHTLKDILRHELAHFFCDVLYGEDTSAHGENFLKVCQNFKWDKNISKASLDIEKSLTHKSGQLDSERIITKVKNLLELAKSDNEHEASLATAKANALLLKHNLEKASLDQDYFYVDLIYKSKKNNSKVASFYQILQHFLVCPEREQLRYVGLPQRLRPQQRLVPLCAWHGAAGPPEVQKNTSLDDEGRRQVPHSLLLRHEEEGHRRSRDGGW